MHTKDASQSVHNINTRRIDAPLKGADVGTINLGAMGKLFLRQTLRMSQPPEIERQHLSYLHPRETTLLQSISPRSILDKRCLRGHSASRSLRILEAIAMSKVLPAFPAVRACFLDRLRELRVAKFPSPRAFACALGMEETHYLRYERGEVEPNLPLIVRVCIVLDVTPNDLFPILPAAASLPEREQRT